MEHPILPPELFDLVIGHLANDRATLIVASLTCRQFRHVCQRLLFTTYRLSIRKLEDDPLSPPERLLKTLETSPHLASCIHTLVVGNASDNESCESQDRLFDKLKLPLVYAQVKKLKRLEVNGTSSFRPTWSAIPFQSGLPSNRCDLGRVLPITHLSLRKIRDVPTSWLFTFPKLEELCMDWVATTDDPRLKQEFDAGSLPICLKRIRLSTTHPTLIQLILNNPNTFNLEALEELSIMENLSNGPQGSTLSFLATLPAKAFTTLQRLEIDIDGYYLNPNSISQVLDLRKFSSLRFLQVDWHGSGSLSVLIGWLEGFKVCPNLKVITICLRFGNVRWPLTRIFQEFAMMLEDFLLQLDIETINLSFGSSDNDDYDYDCLYSQYLRFVLEEVENLFPRLVPLERFNLSIIGPSRRVPSYHDC